MVHKRAILLFKSGRTCSKWKSCDFSNTTDVPGSLLSPFVTPCEDPNFRSVMLQTLPVCSRHVPTTRRLFPVCVADSVILARSHEARMKDLYFRSSASPPTSCVTANLIGLSAMVTVILIGDELDT